LNPVCGIGSAAMNASNPLVSTIACGGSVTPSPHEHCCSMNHRRDHSTFIGSPATNEFNVLLAYPDAAHKRLAHKYCAGLSGNLSSVGRVSITEWKFEMFCHPAMSEMAVREVEDASVVVIATNSGEDLPPTVKTWLYRWHAGTPFTSGARLVILLSEGSSASKARWLHYSYLESHARSLGRELVIYASGVSPDESHLFSLAEARRVTEDGLFAVEGFPEAEALVRSALTSIQK
jgi:hypothetical protein